MTESPIARRALMHERSNRPLRDFIVIFSLITLCFLSVWREYLFASPADSYWIPTFTTVSYAAVVFNVLLISSVVWCIRGLIRRSGSYVLEHIGRFAFLFFAIVFPANYIRNLFGVNEATLLWVMDHALVTVPIAIILAGGVLFLVMFRLRELTRALAVFLLVLSPFSIAVVAQAAWLAVYSQPFPEARQALRTEQNDLLKQRVVWLMYDELDLRLAFTDRPADLTLPHFDRFRDQAVFAINARSHSKNTEEAIPSYITGQLVDQAIPVGPNELLLRIEDDDSGLLVDWVDHPTFFTQANRMGANTAIIGMYHPYCRVFGIEVSFCAWYGLNTFSPQAGNSFLGEMRSQLISTLLISKRINGTTTYRDMLMHSSRVVADPQYDVVYIHASVPHGPNIYDRDTGKLTWFNVTKEGYFDNLVLADRFLGDLRKSMEQAGLWDKTTVLITSDHEWRFVADYDGHRVRKVPFLIKMHGQTVPIIYTPAMSPMLITKDLLLATLAEQVTDASMVVEWLDKRTQSLLVDTAL